MILFFKPLFSKIIFQYYSLYHSTILFFLLSGSLSFEGNLQLPVHEPQISFAVRRQYPPPPLGNTPLLSPMATLLNFKSNLIQKVYETQLVRYDTFSKAGKKGFFRPALLEKSYSSDCSIIRLIILSMHFSLASLKNWAAIILLKGCPFLSVMFSTFTRSNIPSVL